MIKGGHHIRSLAMCTLCAFSFATSQPKVVSPRHLSPNVTHKPRPSVAMERYLSSVTTIILLVALSAQVCVAGKCRIRKMSSSSRYYTCMCWCSECCVCPIIAHDPELATICRFRTNQRNIVIFCTSLNSVNIAAVKYSINGGKVHTIHGMPCTAIKERVIDCLSISRLKATT